MRAVGNSPCGSFSWSVDYVLLNLGTWLRLRLFVEQANKESKIPLLYVHSRPPLAQFFFLKKNSTRERDDNGKESNILSAIVSFSFSFISFSFIGLRFLSLRFLGFSFLSLSYKTGGTILFVIKIESNFVIRIEEIHEEGALCILFVKACGEKLHDRRVASCALTGKHLLDESWWDV